SARDLTYRHEPLATLGESLAVCRLSISTSGYALADIDVGAIEVDSPVLIEVDARGHRRRVEFFADDHLGDAVVRLYERYAELLPIGTVHDRATATARSLRTILTLDTNPREPALRDDIEFVDHRRLGFETTRRAGNVLRRTKALFELAENITLRVDDVLDLRPDIILLRSTISGTDRASGGPFEQAKLQLHAFGPDGLSTRYEW